MLDIKNTIKKTQALLSEKEARFLYQLPSKIPKQGVIVEIGSFKGGSTILLAKGSKKYKKRKVYAIDPFTLDIKILKNKIKVSEKNIYPIFKKNINNEKIADWIIPIVQTSEKIANKWNKPISLLWIDGGHQYQSVKKDYLSFRNYLIKGGIVAFHDSIGGVIGNGPKRVIEKYIFNPSLTVC